MKGKRFTKDQIVDILKESSTGTATEDLCRRYGIPEGTFLRWKAKYSVMEISEVRRLKALEDENSRLKRIVAEQALDIQALMFSLSRKPRSIS